MSKRIGRHLSGNVVAYIALFFALTAGAYAATKAPKNSVVSNSIKNGAVTSSDLKAKAVTNAKIASNAVTTAKIKNAQVTEGKIADNAVTGAKVKDGSLTTADLPPFTYTSVTLEGAWTPVGATGSPPSFGKDALGFVHLRGTLRSGVQNTTAFTLPAGFRPAQTEPFSTANIFGGNSTPCVVTVSTDGTVTPGVTGADTGCKPAGTIGVSGITFQAAG